MRSNGAKEYLELIRINTLKIFMIKIEVNKGETIDKALKRLKRKFDQTGVVNELRERSAYEKPSVKKRHVKKKAIYIQKMRQEKDI